MDRRALNREIESVRNGEHPDPFAFLGMHPGATGGEVVVRTFQPGAERVEVVDAAGPTPAGELERVHPEGFFAASLAGRTRPFPYRLRITWPAGTEEVDDPFRFPPVLGELDRYFLAEGTHLRSWEKLGAHPRTLEGVAGVSFAVWAPNARRVSVVGDFNGWDGRRHPMRCHPGCGVWEIFIPGLGEETLYKYELLGAAGEHLPLKTDPFAFRCEVPPRTAAVVHELSGFTWSDEEWLRGRGALAHRRAPLSIYEVHLGSWRRVPEEGDRPLTYRELADQLIPYTRDMGFTHLELLPVSEHPFDGSWGYQPLGLFAPTSRHGPPDDFRAFVDRCHREGIGVILDWVAGHFPEDEHGLVSFDGTHLYEHADPRQGRHADWGTLVYNYGRSEVRNFLLANALFWLKEYHIDALRVDAVASMLYLDYSRPPGEWLPNRFGGRENLEAIAFLRKMNTLVYGEEPGAFTVAEESTAWPMVSHPVHLGGLGFGYKWNMGWMNDTLRFMAHDPVHRSWHHDLLTFGLLYAFHENFILPLSHDEVVHGKGSLLGKMPGDAWQRLANLRAYLTFQYALPGKKLLFMGGEFAQPGEWQHDRSLDWHLLEDPAHGGVRALVRDLNHLYRRLPALHRLDCEPEGFAWIDCNDNRQNVLSWLRRSDGADSDVLVVCNFTPVVRHRYRVGVPCGGRWIEVFNSDSRFYGGSDVGNPAGVQAEPSPWHGYSWSVELTLPPLAGILLLPQPE
jgi:1,4-alpha-glucan branching enzyme